jgi:hypothetical protein
MKNKVFFRIVNAMALGSAEFFGVHKSLDWLFVVCLDSSIRTIFRHFADC